MKYKMLLVLIALLAIPTVGFTLENVKFLFSGNTAQENNKEQKVIEKDGNTQSNEYAKDRQRFANLRDKRDFQGILTFIEDIERKYNGDIKPYTYLLSEVSDALSSYDFGNKEQYLYSAKLSEKVLQNADSIPIEMENRMIAHLSGGLEHFYKLLPEAEWPKQRQKRIQYLFHLWNRLQNGIDRNYDFNAPENKPVLNVPVPGPYLPGSRPEDIKEPDIRAKYEEAIRANAVKIKRRNLQIELQHLDKRLPDFVENFLVQMYSIPPHNLEQLREDIKAFNLQSERTERILKAVGEEMKKSPK
jgi:hypothetical protein